MQNKLDRRQLVKVGVIGGSALSLVSLFYRPTFSDEAMDSDYRFSHLTLDDRKIILSFTETLVGISDKQLSLKQKTEILITIDKLIDSLNPELQKDVLNIFTLFNVPAFRWYLGLFNISWQDAQSHDLLKAIERLQNTKVTIIRIAYQNLQSLVSSAYYCQEFSWGDIGFPGFINFGAAGQ